MHHPMIRACGLVLRRRFARAFFCVLVLIAAIPSLALAEGISLTGRVVDTAGKPVTRAEVQVWRKIQRDGKPRPENERMQFDGRDSLRTDDAGRFQTPAVLEPDQPLRVIALADGMLAARSPWVKPSESKPVDVGDLVLRRLWTVSGRVVDREGKPVAEAEVSHAGDAHKSERTTTDADGRFRLSGVPDGRGCVFLQKVGFRFSGALLDPSQAEVKLVATRSDQPIEPLKTLPLRVPAEEQVVLARRLLEPYLKAAAESGADIDKNWAISALAHFDPVEALERIEKVHWPGGLKQRTRDWVLELMIERQPPERLEEAVPYIEASEATESAAAAYIQLARAVPVEDRVRRLDYVQHALVYARNSKEPERLVFLAQIGEHLYELGEEDHARRLAEEVHKVAEQSSDQVLGWTLGVIPLALARIDLPGSLALLDRLSDSDYAYRMGMLALRLADRDPVEAEHVWKLPSTRKTENMDFLIRRDNRRAARVCYHMARVDRERAQRIADGVTELIWKTYGLGAMAYALADADPAAARQLLVDVLAGSGPQEHPVYTTPNRKAIAVAWLLPVAEQVDAQLAAEYFWRALSLRSARPTVAELDDSVEYWDAELAKMVARYDVKIARAMLEPLVERMRRAVKLSTEVPLDMRSVLEAAATVDPHWAVELVEGLPEPPDVSVSRPKNWARVIVAPILGSPGKWDWHMDGYWHPASPKYY